jgi:hypothetical protein
MEARAQDWLTLASLPIAPCIPPQTPLTPPASGPRPLPPLPPLPFKCSNSPRSPLSPPQGHALYLRYLCKRPPPAARSPAAPPAAALTASETSGLAPTARGRLPADTKLQGNVLIDETATVGPGCVIGPDVSIGAGCVVAEGVRLANCILLSEVHVGAHAAVLDSILGWRSSVGERFSTPLAHLIPGKHSPPNHRQ